LKIIMIVLQSFGMTAWELLKKNVQIMCLCLEHCMGI